METYFEPREAAKKKMPELSRVTEMTKFESAFLCGLIKSYRPKKIVEVGVAAGGTTSIILQCIDLLKMNNECKLYSVDLNEAYYRKNNQKKTTGFLGEEIKKKIGHVQHECLFGKVLPECIEKIGGGIDLIVLDTVHFLPGELLDFLVALPFLSKNAIVVLHDTACQQYAHKDEHATQIVLDVAVGEKIIPLGMDNTKEDKLPNISAIRITSDTMKYLDDVFHALVLNWWYIPSDSQIKSYGDFYNKYYSNEQEEWYELGVRLNRNYTKNRKKMPVLKRVRRSIGVLIHGF